MNYFKNDAFKAKYTALINGTYIASNITDLLSKNYNNKLQTYKNNIKIDCKFLKCENLSDQCTKLCEIIQNNKKLTIITFFNNELFSFIYLLIDPPKLV